MCENEYELTSEFVSESESETKRLGSFLGDALEPGLLIGLNGVLGSGKTRLTQAIGMSLGLDANEVVSPTFTICIPHEGRLPFLHLDAYRIKHPEEIDELGLDELAEDGVILIIEWADLIRDYLPAIDLEIHIDTIGLDSRRFRLQSNSKRGHQLLIQVLDRLNDSPTK